jgi:hypothetical protein
MITERPAGSLVAWQAFGIDTLQTVKEAYRRDHDVGCYVEGLAEEITRLTRRNMRRTGLIYQRH